MYRWGVRDLLVSPTATLLCLVCGIRGRSWCILAFRPSCEISLIESSENRSQVQGYPIIGALFSACCVCAWRRHARLSLTCIVVYPHQTASLLGHGACRSFASQTLPDCPLSHRKKVLHGSSAHFVLGRSIQTRSNALLPGKWTRANPPCLRTLQYFMIAIDRASAKIM